MYHKNIKEKSSSTLDIISFYQVSKNVYQLVTLH